MNIEFQRAMRTAREKLEAKLKDRWSELDKAHRQHGGSHRQTQSKLQRLAKEIDSLNGRIERINSLIEKDAST